MLDLRNYYNRLAKGAGNGSQPSLRSISSRWNISRGLCGSSLKVKFHYASYSSELAPNMFGASSELVRS